MTERREMTPEECAEGFRRHREGSGLPPPFADAERHLRRLAELEQENARLREAVTGAMAVMNAVIDFAPPESGAVLLCRDAIECAREALGEEPCPTCGRPRFEGCGCWLDDPSHPWARAGA